MQHSHFVKWVNKADLCVQKIGFPGSSLLAYTLGFNIAVISPASAGEVMPYLIAPGRVQILGCTSKAPSRLTRASSMHSSPSQSYPIRCAPKASMSHRGWGQATLDPA